MIQNNTLATIDQVLSESININTKILNDRDLINKINAASDVIEKAFRSNNKVLFCGNGGSAADAQHLASELSGKFYMDRKALHAEALHVNTSYMTAVANDYSFDIVYSRIIEGIGNPGDVLVGLSTSGNSKNVLNAMETAQAKEMITIGFTGDTGGKMKEISNILINIPSFDTPRIQEGHIMIGHIICQLVEKNIFGT